MTSLRVEHNIPAHSQWHATVRPRPIKHHVPSHPRHTRLRTVPRAEPDTKRRSPEVPSKAPPPSSPLPEPPALPKYPLDINRSWGQILLDKIIDSVDDILMHLRRAFATKPMRGALGPSRVEGGRISLCSEKPIVLILGSGWAAHAVIKVIDTDKFCTVVVSPTNHFLFTPMLPSCAVGSIEFRSLLEPIRVANPFVNYLEVRGLKRNVLEHLVIPFLILFFV